MADEFVTVEFPSGAESTLRIRCAPAGKHRFAAWLDGEFIGQAISRVDGSWAGKSPYEETYPGCVDRNAALLGLLELRSRAQGLILELQASELKKVAGGIRDFGVWPASSTSSPSQSSAGPWWSSTSGRMR